VLVPDPRTPRSKNARACPLSDNGQSGTTQNWVKLPQTLIVAGKRVTDQVPWTEMSFMLSHVCRRGELKGYSPPPGGFIVVPSYATSGVTSTISAPTDGTPATPRTTPKPEARATPA
jgi:hypothetical protein